MINRFKKEENTNTGYVIGCQTFEGDAFGAIGRHCMYLRGVNKEKTKLICHNSFGPTHCQNFTPNLNDGNRKFLLYKVTVKSIILTG
jgi:hypothetical protein